MKAAKGCKLDKLEATGILQRRSKVTELGGQNLTWDMCKA